MAVARIPIADGVEIDERDLHETFVRATGPGGQNVNKVSSAVQLRFDVAASSGLAPDIRDRLIALAGRRMTKSGAIVIIANRFRAQERNREDARARLFALIAAAARPPPPARRKTRPGRASKERRLADKKNRGLRKKERSTPQA